jgi:multidrug efflux pump subunit AcrB
VTIDINVTIQGLLACATALSFLITAGLCMMLFYGFSGRFWESLGAAILGGIFNGLTFAFLGASALYWVYKNVHFNFH